MGIRKILVAAVEDLVCLAIVRHHVEFSRAPGQDQAAFGAHQFQCLLIPRRWAKDAVEIGGNDTVKDVKVDFFCQSAGPERQIPGVYRSWR